nr:MAG TPA: hypothetical protein [Caudoviricetes sp.]
MTKNPLPARRRGGDYWSRYGTGAGRAHRRTACG